jgi:hypothetical protein
LNYFEAAWLWSRQNGVVWLAQRTFNSRQRRWNFFVNWKRACESCSTLVRKATNNHAKSLD